MQKKMILVNDISGFGRCSITVSLPILSAMKVQCGILPTAILSNHTDYPDYSMLDFTPYMEEYIEKWKSLHFQFDGIYTGFLGSSKQISILLKLLKQFSFSHIIIDPVMGDHGCLYDSYTTEMCEHMKSLVSHATLTTPNVTELCILTDHKYHENLSLAEIKTMCEILSKTGPQQIIVTGIEKDELIGNALFDKGSFKVLYTRKIMPLRPGTGDVFTSILAGYALQNLPLEVAIEKASKFIGICLETSKKWDLPPNDGVCFEEHLDFLLT